MQGISFRSASGNHYFYDDDCGLIFPSDSAGNLKTPYGTQMSGLALGGRNPPPVGVLPERIQNHLLDQAYGFRHLILELTAKCNLRCKYCVYSDHYPVRRGFSDATMDAETAWRGVELFMEQHERVRERNPSACPIIGFYGGEPLLRFDVIRETLERFWATYGARCSDPLLTITTNGLLLDDAIGDFLVDNGFSIIVSLDGDKAHHDRNRVRADGQGSFDTVIANLRAFRKRHPDYKRLAISTCYDYDSDFAQLSEFFDREGLFVCSISQVDQDNTDYYAQFCQDDISRFAAHYEGFRQLYAEKVKKDDLAPGTFLHSFIGVSFAGFAFHPVTIERRPDFLPYTSTCVPGEKLYVTPDGNLHMCERIGHQYAIGSLEAGVDYTRVADLITQYNQKVCQACPECPVTRLCNRCFASMATTDGFRRNAESCERLKASVADTLVKFVDIAEVRPNFVDDITIDYYRNIMDRVGYVVE